MDIKKLVAVAAISVLTLAGCAQATEETTSTAGSTTDTSTEEAIVTSDIKVCIYTSGGGGAFWSVLQAGAEQAGIDLGITIDYQGSDNDSARQAASIDAGIAAGCDAIAASAPDPGAIKSATLAAAAAGIPLVTLNSGSPVFKELGAFTHVGQDEILAGREAGLKFKAAGVNKVLCTIHEAANTGLQQRCDGARETFGNVVDFNVDGGLQDLSGASAKIKAALQADPSIDGVFAVNADIAAKAVLPAVQELGGELTIGTTDMSADALQAIKDGSILFAIDQQQFAQGYLSVVLLYLNLTNGHVLGGGLPIYTGPGFVDAGNVDQVMSLVEAGTR